MRVADIEFINIKNADKTGVGNALVSTDTLVFFNLHGIKQDELEEILKYKSFTYSSWKKGKTTEFFVFKYGWGKDSTVIWCYSGFSTILIRLLQNKYGFTINGKELYRAKEITSLPKMRFTLWDFQRDAIQAWVDSNCYGILQCPTAAGKCCKYNTLILTDNGLLKIKDLVKGISNLRHNKDSLDYYAKDENSEDNNIKVVSVQGNNDYSINTKLFNISNKYDMGINDTITIKTKIGIEICGTPDHKIVIIDKNGNINFKMLKDITNEDNIAISYNTNIYNKELKLNHQFTDKSKYAIYSNNVKNVEYMNPELARLLGYAIAEGNVSGNSFIITSFDIEMQDDIIKICKNIGLDINYRIDKEKNNGNPSGIIISSVEFIDFIRYIGYIDFSKNKEIPWSILQSNKECQIEFIKAIFDGDGTLGYESIDTYNESDRKNISTLEYSSSSYELCRQLQLMLLNIGIIGRLNDKKEATHEYKGVLKTFERSYRLILYGSELLKYAEQIGFNLSRKKEVINKFVQLLNERERHSEIVYPNINKKLNILHEKLKDKGKKGTLYIDLKVKYPSGSILTERKMFSYTSYLNHYKFKQMWSYVSGTRFPCRDTLDYILKLFEPVKDENWIYLNELRNNFIFDKIETITEGKEHIYDMTVEEVHSYIGNSVVNHNSIIGCSIIKKMNVKTIILCHTSDLLINVWYDYIIQQFGEEIKDRLGLIGGGLSKKDRKLMGIIGEDFDENIKKDIVIATSQSLLSGNKLVRLGEERFGLMIVDEIHHYSSEQFKRVAGAVRAAYRLGLSATLHRSDGLSPIFHALLGDVRYKIGIKELVKKGLLVEPIFYSIIVNDEEACNKIVNCRYKLLEYSRYVKKISGSSSLKFKYILGLCESLKSKGRKFMLYTDFVNKNVAVDENGKFILDENVFVRDDYVRNLRQMNIKVIGIASEMSGLDRQSIFKKLGNNEIDGIVFGGTGNEGINIPSVDAIIMVNATASTIRFPQRTGRGMRLYKGKKNCYVYEILLNVPKELQWSEANFLEYAEQGFSKERIYVNNEGYLMQKEIKELKA